MKSILLVACLLVLSALTLADDVETHGVGWCQTVGERCRHTGNMKCCNNLECENQFCRRKNVRCQKLNERCQDFGSETCCDNLRCKGRGNNKTCKRS